MSSTEKTPTCPPAGQEHEADSSTSVGRQARDRLAEREAELRAEAPPVIPPCPSWCVSTAALHPLDFELEDGVYVRTHEAYAGTIATVEATERSDGNGGPVTISQPEIRMYGADFDGVPVTPASAMVLGAEIWKAKDVLDQLTAPTTVPPCPSWCARSAGHGYRNVAHKYNGSPVYEREHSAHPEGEVNVDVVTTEHYLRGKVDVDAPVGRLMVDEGAGWYSTGLREPAAEITTAADLLERIEAAGEADASPVQDGTPAPVLDDRGQPADLDGYEPQNR
jgi:hypothetical protein